VLLEHLFFAAQEKLESNNLLYFTLFRLAINVQFSLFSLLIVYYAHLHHNEKNEWYDLKRKYVAAWFIANVILLILQLVWIFMESQANWLPSPEDEGFVGFHSIPNFFTGIIYGLLVIVLAWHGWKVVQKIRSEGTNTHHTRLVAHISWVKISVITVALFTFFSLRCIYDFVSALSKSEYLAINVDDQASLYQMYFKFFAYTFWEVLPTGLVFILFGTIPATTLGVFSKQSQHSRKVPSYAKVTRISLPQSESRLFHDPKRYDSDDESGLKNSFGSETQGSLHTFASINQSPQDRQPLLPKDQY